MKKLQYLFRINKDPNSDWGASVPDHPGCVAAGKSIDITLRRIKKAIALHLRAEDHHYRDIVRLPQDEHPEK